jgi:hypothetical protein
MLAIVTMVLGAFAAPLQTPTHLHQVLGLPVATRDLHSPTFVTSWPGNSDILVVAERGVGQITAWLATDVGFAPKVVVDLTTAVSPPVFIPTSFLDFIGVTGFAFHPSFLTDPNKRFIYVRYNEIGQPSPNFYRMNVVRWRIKPGQIEVDPMSKTLIYSYPMDASGHGSGTLQFAPDPSNGSAVLYIPMPDDAGVNPANDCPEMVEAQGPINSLDIGRLLSIDVDAANPIVTRHIQGLRNPFGFSVDRGHATTGQGKGDVWLGDTGWMNTGSVIRWTPGSPIQNYGWPWRQLDGTGAQVTQPMYVFDQPCVGPNPPPAYTNHYFGFSDFSANWPPSQVQDAMIGGYVYRGSTFAPIQNRYVFGTYGIGFSTPRIYHIDPVSSPNPSIANISGLIGISNWSGYDKLHALGQDYDGELYVVRVYENNIPSQINNGKVYRIQ